ncbi:cation/hydrogen exchanger 15 [Actinidia rufa]|uniref:Cation/hydrogen exchanger 15 n=1 Tax=Actinidia rufa TaxID=165716 RepID=A0A7J0F673_9ERIC|nr:cation/hydrogen exchanger 15 [Actinidia rufa]
MATAELPPVMTAPGLLWNETAGLLLGPSGMGQWFGIMGNYLFVKTSLVMLETIANIGILYFAFIVGLEMDLSVIRKNGKKGLLFAISVAQYTLFFAFFVVRPGIAWLATRSTPEDESFSNFTTSTILAGVMILGFITDCIGVHPTFGAFVLGLFFPPGPLAVSLVERLKDFITGFLLPLFFVISGFKTNVSKIKGASTWVTIIFASILSSAGKVAGTVLVALFLKMPFQEGVALGLLMNSKGVVELLGLNHGKDQKVIDDTAYAIMVVTCIFMNAIIMPIVVKIYRPARKFVPYKRRTVQKTKTDAELRILTCIHTPRNAPTIISLLEASHPTRKSPISVVLLHLVELTGHASATLIVHNPHKSERQAINRMEVQSDHIINAFETFEQHTSCVSVQSLTSISPYSTMHEEICNLAEDKRVAFIIVPFHKQPTVDGGMESANPKIRMLNQNVLANAPCSVGILVDRGLNCSKRLAASQVSHNIAVLFFGGADDREALSYAVRMSEHPGNTLNVIRFLPGPHAVKPTIEPNQDFNDQGVLTLQIVKEKQLDDDYIKEFRMMKANDESFSYIEKVVNNGEETVSAIRSVDNIHDLFVVGRREGTISPLTAGLNEWSECPELGVIGDLLASADFAAAVSVLVVQQYVGAGPNDEGIGTPDNSSQQQEEQCIMDSVRH